MIFGFTFIEIYFILGVTTAIIATISFLKLVKSGDLMDKLNELRYSGAHPAMLATGATCALFFLIVVSILAPPAIWYLRYKF